ncbi:choline/ethanolamine kinase-like isoform X1 [Amphibalanus amphitrite]|uniref:choline/ethanolamine kinase-like isoform X1 n=2 Tax=Amphibalanus amphitrite TaxID=1232801 RepID=UPI001C90E56B|nr:choline/ethanolamine kinase-like isoform X1 [Amphibalanus amphitrite]
MVIQANSHCFYGVEEMRNQAHGLCRDYLHGAWQLISPDDMVIKPISGGMSNFLFLCELPDDQQPLAGEPCQVLLRMYGQVQDGGHESITESVIFTLLAERRLGPKLYGIFPGGRLEEFIQASSLRYSDLRSPEVSRQIARQLATVHSLDVPICKEPRFIWQMMKKWIRMTKECLDDRTMAEHADKVDVIKSLRLVSFEQEMEWLKRYFDRVPSPVVFCHNDLQEGNVLRHSDVKGGRQRLTLIDFEYCSYNYRGFDLANHFCEWLYDYSSPQPPFFTEHPDRWPSRDEQLRFIRAYLEHRFKTAAVDDDDEHPVMDKEQLQREEESMLDEINVYSLGSHLFWAVWSITNAATSSINFGYWDYSLCRLKAYQRQKQHLMESDPRCPKMAQGVKRNLD